MSRGLERFIKEQIYKADREYRAEEDALRAAGSDESPKHRFWLGWWEIKHRIEAEPKLNPGPELSPSLQRSAKRALHRLVERGEIGRESHPDGSHYMTKETYEENFSPKATEQLSPKATEQLKAAIEQVERQEGRQAKNRFLRKFLQRIWLTLTSPI